MSEGFEKDELLGVPQIARYLRVSEVTSTAGARRGGCPL